MFFISLFCFTPFEENESKTKMVVEKLMLLANLLPRALLTKKPEDSGHEIGYSALVTNGNKLLFFFSSAHDRM